MIAYGTNDVSSGKQAWDHHEVRSLEASEQLRLVKEDEIVDDRDYLGARHWWRDVLKDDSAETTGLRYGDGESVAKYGRQGRYTALTKGSSDSARSRDKGKKRLRVFAFR
jgi:hypothetical protein